MLWVPVFIFTSGSSALLGYPHCGLSIWLSLLSIFNTLFWVFFMRKRTKLKVRHFHMIWKWPSTVIRHTRHSYWESLSFGELGFIGTRGNLERSLKWRLGCYMPHSLQICCSARWEHSMIELLALGIDKSYIHVLRWSTCHCKSTKLRLFCPEKQWTAWRYTFLMASVVLDKVSTATDKVFHCQVVFLEVLWYTQKKREKKKQTCRACSHKYIVIHRIIFEGTPTNLIIIIIVAVCIWWIFCLFVWLFWLNISNAFKICSNYHTAFSHIDMNAVDSAQR